MQNVPAVTCMFLDIGGVLLTDGWGRHARKRATAHFELDAAAIEDRHQVTWNTYQEGKLSLDEYMSRVIFYEKRPFTRAQFRRFILRSKHGQDVPEIRNWKWGNPP